MTTPKRNEAVAPVAWLDDCGQVWGYKKQAARYSENDPTPLVAAKDYEALQGEVSRLRADAARYRYLRDHANPDSDEGFAVMREEMNGWGKWCAAHVTGDALDAAIDSLNLEPPTDGR